MDHKALKDQKKSFKNILKSVRNTRFADFIGISALNNDEKFTEVFARYVGLMDVVNHEQLVALLRRATHNTVVNDIELINLKGLISNNKFSRFAYTRRGFVRPVDDYLLKQLDIIEDYIKYVYKQHKISGRQGKTFYMFDRASIKYLDGVDVGELRVLQLARQPWYKTKKYLPNLKELVAAGNSHNQCLHAMLDDLEVNGKDVTTLVASARQIVELGLLYSQRRGEFATFKNLLPNLKLWVNDTGFYSVNQKLIDSTFVGLNVKKVDIYNSVTGALALQEDVKKPGVLTLQTDMDVFYEFIPLEFVDATGKVMQSAKRFHVGSVELNKDYVLAVSNKSGLLSITTSDVVRVVSQNPFRVVYLRRSQALNAAQEMLNTHLINHVIATLNNILSSYHIIIRDYLVGYDSLEKRHLWALELNKSPDLIDEKILASITNRIHKMLMQDSKLYKRAVDETSLNAPRIYMLALGGLNIIERPKGVYGLDISEDASLVRRYLDNNSYKAFQAANVKVFNEK